MKTTTTQEALESALALATAGDWKKANEILGAFGVEYVSLEGRELKYLNLGDTYDATICQEDNDKPFIGSWGNWYESAEADHCEDTDTIRCGYCGEFTDNNQENWHDVKCSSCGHKVGGD